MLAMESLNPETDPIRKDLIDHRAKVVIQWIPGHSQTLGNERADTAAKEVTSMPEDPCPITLQSVDETKDQRIREVYRHFNKDKDYNLQEGPSHTSPDQERETLSLPSLQASL